MSEPFSIATAPEMTAAITVSDVSKGLPTVDGVLAPRPGRVREKVAVATPRPRDPTALEVTRYIQRLCALI